MEEEQPTSLVVEGIFWAMPIALMVAALVIVLTSQPPPPPLDKILHAVGAAVLTISLLLAAVWRPGRGEGAYPRGGIFVTGFVVLLAVAVELFEELHYRLIEGWGWGDLAAGVGGATIGWGIWAALRALLIRRA